MASYLSLCALAKFLLVLDDYVYALIFYITDYTHILYWYQHIGTHTANVRFSFYIMCVWECKIPEYLSLVLKKMSTTERNLFECSVCYSRYDHVDRKPKYLSCHHTVCLHCITVRKHTKHILKEKMQLHTVAFVIQNKLWMGYSFRELWIIRCYASSVRSAGIGQKLDRWSLTGLYELIKIY